MQFWSVTPTTNAPRTDYHVATNTDRGFINVFTAKETGFGNIGFLQVSLKVPVSFCTISNLWFILFRFENIFLENGLE